MAGKRQHYIPRLLLKGFSCRTDGEKDFVWYFRKGKCPKEVSIRDVALSKGFYGNTGATSLDEKITSKEQQYGETIGQLRKCNKIIDSDIPMIVDFVVNLITRTNHFRVGLTNAYGGFVEMFRRNLSNPQKFTNILIESVEQNKDEFQNTVRKAVQNNLGAKNPAIEELAIRYAEERVGELASKLSGKGPQIMEQMFTQFLDGLKKEGTKAHQNSLSKFINQDNTSERYKQYSKLEWSVKGYPPNTFILGDVGVLGIEADSGSFFHPIFNKSNDFTIILPISHDSLLIGGTSAESSLPVPNEININAVEMSIDFFVSSDNNQREREYKDRIGNRATFFKDGELEGYEKSYFGNL